MLKSKAGEKEALVKLNSSVATSIAGKRRYSPSEHSQQRSAGKAMRVKQAKASLQEMRLKQE